MTHTPEFIDISVPDGTLPIKWHVDPIITQHEQDEAKFVAEGEALGKNGLKEFPLIYARFYEIGGNSQDAFVRGVAEQLARSTIPILPDNNVPEFVQKSFRVQITAGINLITTLIKAKTAFEEASQRFDNREILLFETPVGIHNKAMTTRAKEDIIVSELPVGIRPVNNMSLLDLAYDYGRKTGAYRDTPRQLSTILRNTSGQLPPDEFSSFAAGFSSSFARNVLGAEGTLSTEQEAVVIHASCNVRSYLTSTASNYRQLTRKL